MEKLWASAKFKTRNRIHAENILARRNRTKNSVDIAAPLFFRSGRIETISAPEVLSVIDKPDDCTTVIFRMLSCETTHLYFDLGKVARITPDAIALITASVRYLGGVGVNVRGNYPSDAAALDAIHQSGFDELFNKNLIPSASPRGHLLCDDRLAVDSKKADATKAQRLIDMASNGGKELARLKSSYGHLIDCMTNTHEHAAPKAGTERWWASVFIDKERACDCFTFIDLGVGIFGSAKLNFYRRLQAKFSMTRPDIIRSLFSGGIPSSTGLGYRGRGLPSLYESLGSHAISRLVIVTDDVYADMGANHFDHLTFGLKGLLLYWEVPHASDGENTNA